VNSAPTKQTPLDTAFRVATPEGVELQLRLAGPVPRALAWVIDFFWRAAALIGLAMVLGQFGGFGFGLLLIAWFVLEWLVPAWCEAEWDGATPGKKAMGLRVLGDDGAPIGWGQALSRNLLRFADFLPFFYLGGLLAMLCNEQFKRLGDFVAGTVVVHVEQVELSRPIHAGQARAPLRKLSLEEARVVLDLAERAAELGRERSAELIGLAAPLLGERAGEIELNQVANHLLGGSPGNGRAPS
jgi:uncharacterized RDD family membrane protein YckC